MSERLLDIYHRLPPLLQCVAASLRGYYLRSWRYGPETERLTEAALEREHWTAERWEKWQKERLVFVLERAAKRVPYYRQQWETRRRKGDRVSPGYLEHWPILEKDTLRENPKAFIADDCDPRRMFHEHTSGTTGKPLDVWLSRDTVRAFYALWEARWRRWYGVSRLDRWAILGGQLVTSTSSRRPPFWAWNAALNQLYMSSYHLAPDLIPYYVDALNKYRIKYIFAYSSSLYALAQEIVHRQKNKKLQMMVAITNAEPLFEYQRRMISEAFHCPVRETYGMTEIVAAAAECTFGRLHMWPEAGWIEVLKDGRPVDRGTSGDLVCTGLLNADMPLIRYRVGDRGTLDSVRTDCVCGRFMPVLASVEGRSDEVLYTSDGRSIGRLDPVFKANLPLREAQIIQESLNRLRVRYVPEAGFTPAHGRSIIERLQARMGEIEVILEEIKVVPRTRNGKFRAVINVMNSRSEDHVC